MITTFRARRRIHVLPGIYREPQELLPEAVTWFRVEDQLHGGHIVEAEVSEIEFEDAVEQFCPEQRERIYALLGHTPRPRVNLIKAPAAPPPPPAPVKSVAKKAPAKKAAAKKAPGKKLRVVALKPELATAGA